MHYLLLNPYNSVVHAQKETAKLLNLLHCFIILMQTLYWSIPILSTILYVVESWKCCNVKMYKIWLKGSAVFQDQLMVIKQMLIYLI